MDLAAAINAPIAIHVVGSIKEACGDARPAVVQSEQESAV